MIKFTFLQLLFLLLVIFFNSNVYAEQQNLPRADKLTTPNIDVPINKTSSETSTENNPLTNSTKQSVYTQGSVTRSIFTTEIIDHEPTDNVKKLHSDKRNVFYFTELRNMSGQTAIHRWEFNGNIMAEKKFTIEGPRWRVWSSKNLLPNWIGEWKVSVINGSGNVISEDIVDYIELKIPTQSISESNSSSSNNENTVVDSRP